MLKLKNITKKYVVEKQTTHALQGIDLEFRENEFVAILGPSGCGKTTLLNIIGGLDRYDEGEMFISGVSTKNYLDCDWDQYRNHKIGFVFQSYNLIMHQRVGKNVELALTIGGMDKKEKKHKVEMALERVGLSTQIRKKPNQLSGGQMQRVAIARAIVTKPDIILADEPTGALDSESSIQVMEILKEVSEDKLVIMVTHNPEIAEQYATRIIKISDGKVVSDSNPYISNEDDYPVEVEDKPLTKTQRRKLKRSKDFKRKKQYSKTAMKITSSSMLSFGNLLSKKGRTILTTIAGSIGIIGISFVLALSTGFSGYIKRTEENALSKYPITIEETSFSISAIMELLMTQNETREKYPDADDIYVGTVLSNVIKNIGTLFSQNDLASLKVYLDENFDSENGFYKYSYGTDLNLYSDYVSDGDYVKINPFMDRVETIMGDIPLMKGLLPQIGGVAKDIKAWDELVENQRLLNSQYDLLGNSRWPSEKDEIILVADEYNQIDDYMLFALGLKSPADISKAMNEKSDFASTVYSIDDLLGIEYKILRDCDYYQYDETTEKWTDYSTKSDEDMSSFIEENGISLKVVGVVRPKKGVEGACITGAGAYTKALSDYIATSTLESPIVKAQKEAFEGDNKIDLLTGEAIEQSDYNDLMTKYGVVDLSKPTRIYLYANSFDTKDNIIQMLDNYKVDTGKEVKYTDTLALLMSSITKILDSATAVLAGFSAISLIVSSIMIAIITYTSVVERTKEIGVLRSLGARKKDIADIFNSETAMIGFASGVFGVFVTFIISLIANKIVYKYVDIPNVMNLVWWQALCMIGLSILLSMIAGIIPSQLAAKKDPVTALRSGE